MKGCVFNIEEFSVYDGPGIRTTVFLKGCPLKCSWCHNPEGQNPCVEVIKKPNGCIMCNNCFNSALKINNEFRFSENSIKNCPMGLLRFCGEYFDSDTLCDTILKNKNLLQNGGVTFSGGEPLFQSDFLFECLFKLKGKVHTAIQTSGYCNEDVFSKAIELTDYFLFDLKIINDSLHREYTGKSNKIILNNFSALAKSNTDFVVRVPLIPGVTDTKENFEDIIKTLKRNNVDYLELLPYNKMAGGKYKMLGRTYKPDFDEQLAVKINEEILDANGIKFMVL